MGKVLSRDNTVFLRFLAILLVINSHMDSLYPIPVFATGGAVGNSLFFMLSAFGLLLSEKNNAQTFAQYFIKRIVRIYPVVWTSILFLILPITFFFYFTSITGYQIMRQEYHLSDPLSIIGLIFYPPFWFLQALMFFYLIGFFFVKNYQIRKIVWTLSFLALLYVVLYLQFSDFSHLVIEETMNFKLVFYGMVFLTGIYFASINDKIIYEGWRDFVILLATLGLIYMHKYLMLNGMLSQFQFVQQLLIFPMLYYFLKISRSPLVLDVIMKQRYIANVITLIGAMTLELYIVHGLIRPICLKYFSGFPENIFIYLFFVLVISYLFYKGNDFLINRMKKVAV